MTSEQEKMLGLLRVFDDLCRKNSLQYFLVGGTLLGAVRHKGFIPWDDDIDVQMPLEDYNRFLALKDQLPEGLVIQNEDVDNTYPFLFSKLCDTKMPFETKARNGPWGIYIDIFPAMPSRKRTPPVHFCYFLNAVIRYVLERKNGWREETPHRNSLVRIACGVLCRLPNKLLKGMRLFLRKLVYAPKSKTTICSFGGDYHAKREFYRAEWFAETETALFEGMECPIPAGWDPYLKEHYGDYMRLPPEEERTSSHRS